MIKLYNTLTKTNEEFRPVNENIVNMYTCGPTVYGYAHIGNFRAYIFMDVLRRVLKYNGYEINGMMNITDVGHLTDDADDGEDKMQIAAKKENKSPYEIAKFYTEAFFNDAKKLNIEMPKRIAYATEHIDEMIKFVQDLIEAGYAYEVKGNVYFDVAKYNEKYEYGQLSGANLDDQLAGARIEINTDKKSPYDFALWIKAPKKHIMKWKSPWGKGYPGWHIECSAMSRKYLGDQFDIHTGGVDHIPIHHENEIAQSQGLTGKNHARFWMHCEFLKVDNGKMSKSLGNTYTISDLEKKGYTALDYRYFTLNANFRKTQNFTWEALESAKVSRERLINLLFKHKNSIAFNAIEYKKENKDFNIDDIMNNFKNFINDDLNIPAALGVLWEMVKFTPYNIIYKAAMEMDKILGLQLKEQVNELEQKYEKVKIPNNIKEVAEARWQAKINKNFAESDELRNKLKVLGYSVKDSKDGYKLTKD